MTHENHFCAGGINLDTNSTVQQCQTIVLASHYCGKTMYSNGMFCWCVANGAQCVPKASSIGCNVYEYFETDTDKFNCSAGYTEWKGGWSDAKKSWCCQVLQKGCQTSSMFQAFNAPNAKAPASAITSDQSPVTVLPNSLDKVRQNIPERSSLMESIVSKNTETGFPNKTKSMQSTTVVPHIQKSKKPHYSHRVEIEGGASASMLENIVPTIVQSPSWWWQKPSATALAEPGKRKHLQRLRLEKGVHFLPDGILLEETIR